MHRSLLPNAVAARRAIAVVLTLLLFGVSCKREAPEPTGPEAVRRKRQQERRAQRDTLLAELKDDARVRYRRHLAAAPKFDPEAVSKQLLKEQYGIDLDAVTLRTPEEVRLTILERAEAKAELRYPKARRVQFRRQIARDFPHHGPGTLVEVTTTTGRKIKDTVEWVAADSLKIGQVTLRFADIAAPDIRCFDVKARERYLRRTIHAEFDLPREEYLKQLARKLHNGVYRESGYRPVPQAGNAWLRGDEIIRRFITPKLPAIEKKFDRETEARVREAVVREMQEAKLFDIPKGLDPITPDQVLPPPRKPTAKPEPEPAQSAPTEP